MKRWQPSISGTTTSATVGHEAPIPVLTASGKKLGFLCHQLGRGREEFSELESCIPGSASTEATAEMQGLRLIDCQSLIASVRMGTRCAACSSPLEVKGKLDLGFLGSVGQSFIASHFLEGSLGLNKSCNITFVLFFNF